MASCRFVFYETNIAITHFMIDLLFLYFFFSFKLEELQRESEFWKKNKPQENGQGDFFLHLYLTASFKLASFLYFWWTNVFLQAQISPVQNLCSPLFILWTFLLLWNLYKSLRPLQLKVIGNKGNWTLGREKGGKTEIWLLIAAVFAGELKETEVRKSCSLKVNKWEVLSYFILYVRLNRRWNWDVAESIATGS